MKSVIASLMAAVVLASGFTPVAVEQQAFPRWFCDIFPPFCQR